jgi:hypothetical protein
MALSVAAFDAVRVYKFTFMLMEGSQILSLGKAIRDTRQDLVYFTIYIVGGTVQSIIFSLPKEMTFRTNRNIPKLMEGQNLYLPK